MSEKKHKRKTYFLPNTSQAKILLAVQIILAVIGLIASAVLFILLNRDLTANFFSAHLTLRNVRDILFPSLLIINIVLLMMSGIINIFFSHRIAGPAYRISMVLKKIASGDWSQKAFLRKGDYLKEIASALNQSVDSTTERLGSLHAAYIQLEENMGSDPKSKEALKKMKSALDAFIYKEDVDL